MVLAITYSFHEKNLAPLLLAYNVSIVAMVLMRSYVLGFYALTPLFNYHILCHHFYIYVIHHKYAIYHVFSLKGFENNKLPI